MYQFLEQSCCGLSLVFITETLIISFLINVVTEDEDLEMVSMILNMEDDARKTGIGSALDELDSHSFKNVLTASFENIK